MKLATIANGERDGRLVVVSADATRCSSPAEYRTLQDALHDWSAA